MFRREQWISIVLATSENRHVGVSLLEVVDRKVRYPHGIVGAQSIITTEIMLVHAAYSLRVLDLYYLTKLLVCK